MRCSPIISAHRLVPWTATYPCPLLPIALHCKGHLVATSTTCGRSVFFYLSCLFRMPVTRLKLRFVFLFCFFCVEGRPYRPYQNKVVHIKAYLHCCLQTVYQPISFALPLVLFRNSRESRIIAALSKPPAYSRRTEARPPSQLTCLLGESV